MHGKKPTKSEQRKIDAIHERGCVPCYLESQLRGRDWVPEPCDVHHVVQGDFQFVYGNCPWHHRGIRKNDLPTQTMRDMFGPSMHREPRSYRERYGEESRLLAIQAEMLVQSIPELTESARG